MRPTGIVPILIAASLVASTSCSDTAAPTSPGKATVAPALTTLNGVIHLSQTRANGVVLSLADGEDVTLDGSAIEDLYNIENAEVEVRGTWSDATFLMSDFLVQRVDGTDVMDGILVPIQAQDLDGPILGYALNLTRGPTVALVDPPAELIAHVGERVWVAETADGQAMAFGIIGR